MRNKRRTLLTVSTIALSVAVVIIADRYTAAMLKIWRQSSADHGTGHAQIRGQEYSKARDGLRLEKVLPNQQKLEQMLSSDKQVSAFSRRIRFEGIISSTDKTIYFLGMAVHPIDELKVAPKVFNKETDTGSFLDSANPRGVVIGRGMADTLGLEVGDEAALSILTIKGNTNAVDVYVRGIVDLPVPTLSKRVVFMDLGYAQRALRMQDQYTELALRFHSIGFAETWLPSQEQKLDTLGLEGAGWWVIDPYITKAEAVIDAILGIVGFLLFLCAGISVLNIIYMIVAERTIEIGTLMALGAKPSRIRLLFGLEAAVLGLLGGMVGILLAGTVIGIIGVDGVVFQSPFGSGYVIISPENDLLVSVTAAGIAVLFCILASIPPARKASKVEPVKAFRGQIS